MASAKAAAPAMDAATEKTFEIEKKCWELYFKETTVETAVEPPRLGVRPTVDTVVDTKDHPFITDPMLAMYHRVAEEAGKSPLLQFLKDYVEERDVEKIKKMSAKIEFIVPGEVKQDTLRMPGPYPFVSELEKLRDTPIKEQD